MCQTSCIIKPGQVADVRVRCLKSRQGRHLCPADRRTARLAQCGLDCCPQVRIRNCNGRSTATVTTATAATTARGRYFFAKAVTKDEKITKAYRAIAVQIILRFISPITLAGTKLTSKRQKVGKVDHTIAIKVWRKGL